MVISVVEIQIIIVLEESQKAWGSLEAFVPKETSKAIEKICTRLAFTNDYATQAIFEATATTATLEPARTLHALNVDRFRSDLVEK